jgi:hypothetical protein
MPAAPRSVLCTSSGLRVVVTGLALAGIAVPGDAFALVKPARSSPASSSDDDNTGVIVGVLVTVVVIVIIVVAVVAGIRRSPSATPGLDDGTIANPGFGNPGYASPAFARPAAASGVRGRALVLTSSPNVSGTTVGGVRYERRAMTLEIELPGTAPYQLQGAFLVPRGLTEAIPGSSLDVSVSGTGPSDVTVLGPGGFSGPWLQRGPPQPY